MRHHTWGINIPWHATSHMNDWKPHKLLVSWWSGPPPLPLQCVDTGNPLQLPGVVQASAGGQQLARWSKRCHSARWRMEMMILWTASFNINVGGKILIPMQHLVHIEIMGSGGRVWHEWVDSLLDGLGWGQMCAVAPLHSRLGRWVEEGFSAMSNKSNTHRERKTSNSQWKWHIKKLFNLCRGCRSR